MIEQRVGKPAERRAARQGAASPGSCATSAIQGAAVGCPVVSVLDAR